MSPRLGSVLTAFGALPAEEDSIPRQLYLQKKKSYFSGDPILKEYFPKYLESDYKIGGFNIGDWTVDQPVQDYINKKIEENKFDFLAAHLLRLDHMGHKTLNLASHQVFNSIKDIDRFLVHLMNNIGNNTMLIFAGDHGMTKKGFHGGDTPQETNTAIVAYYKPGFMKYQHNNRHNLKKIMRSINETNDQVNQIDLAPTLSMLMGLPTPFSNMGQILNDLYPVGNYLPQVECTNKTTFDAAFDMQLLKDNHLNTLQIWNYFKKYHEGQTLFTTQEFSQVSNLFQETEAIYKAAQELIRQSRHCENSFHAATVHAIEKSQQLSNQIHDLVHTKTPHDLVVFWQALTILALVGISYILLVQYLYKTKDYEHITWGFPKSWKSVARTIIPIAILLALIFTFMLASSPSIMRPITSAVLVFALCIIGSSVVSLLSKIRENSFEGVNSTSMNEERQPLAFSFKSLFIFQNPLIIAGAVTIIASLFYLTHFFSIDKFVVAELASFTPHIFVLLIGARFSGRYLKFAPYIMAGASLLAIFLGLEENDLLKEKQTILAMGLFLIADWLWGEIQFALYKLKAGKVWSFQYVICFIILALYHLFCDPQSDLVKITLPRVLWALVIVSSLAGFVLKMPRNIIKRNIQVNFVLFLILMQLHRKLLFFGIILSLMRILTFIFKRTQFKNYLYPLLLAFISYFGLFFNGFTDRKLPRDFEPAFVGIHDFHLYLCLFLYGSAMLSTIILGILFMSFYSQDLESQEVKLGDDKSNKSGCEVVALKGDSNVIKKRNILLYNFFFCLIMLGAAINPVILKDHKQVYLSMERFLVDGAFYLFVINAVYFMV